MAAGTMSSPHADEYTLLRFVRGELDEVGAARLRRHAETCPGCDRLRTEMERLHGDILACKDQLGRQYADELALSPRDAFRRRPEGARGVASGDGRFLRLESFAEAARQAEAVADVVLTSAIAGKDAPIAELDLATLRDRYALGYALDGAITRMVEGPEQWCAFGAAALVKVRAMRRRRVPPPDSLEVAYPLLDLEGFASLLVGSACNWTGDLGRGGRALSHAYRCIGRGSGSEIRQAQVELAESQRRSFLGRPVEGLILVDRAAATFETYGLEDQVARARGARGIAFGYLTRHEEAVIEFRAALASFERFELWSAYVSMLNGLGFTLVRMGQLGAARREFARALRRVSRSSEPAVHAFVRANLARILLEAGKYADAARAFAASARLFRTQGAELDALTAMLAEVECHARAGAPAEATAAFGRFRQVVEHLEVIDGSLLESLGAVLTGETPDVDLFEVLRRQAEEALRLRLRFSRTR